MEMPKPGEAHKRLQDFVGTWTGGETLHPSPWAPAGGTATAHIVNRSILDGFAVVQEYEQRQGRVVTFRGHGVFWFDAQKGEYVMTWWDSMGGVSSEFRGNFAGDILTQSSPAPDGGTMRVVWDMSKPGRYTFSMQASPDGQTWQPSMDGSYRIGGGSKKTAKTAAKKKVSKVVAKAAKKAPMKAAAKKAGKAGRAGKKAKRR